MPFADVGPIKINDDDLRDDQVLFLSDIFPTGYMGVEMCNIGRGPTHASTASASKPNTPTASSTPTIVSSRPHGWRPSVRMRCKHKQDNCTKVVLKP